MLLVQLKILGLNLTCSPEPQPEPWSQGLAVGRQMADRDAQGKLAPGGVPGHPPRDVGAVWGWEVAAGQEQRRSSQGRAGSSALCGQGRALASDVDSGPERFPLTQHVSRALQRKQDQGPLKSHSLCLSIYELINIKQLLSGVQA